MPEKQKLGPRQLQWIEALESGKYKQTRNNLHVVTKNSLVPAGYCCLGIACDLFAKQARVSRKINGGVEEFGGSDGSLPKRMVQFLGLFGSDGESRDYEESLTNLNDTWETFKQIARILRKDPGKFFKEPR